MKTAKSLSYEEVLEEVRTNGNQTKFHFSSPIVRRDYGDNYSCSINEIPPMKYLEIIEAVDELYGMIEAEDVLLTATWVKYEAC